MCSLDFKMYKLLLGLAKLYPNSIYVRTNAKSVSDKLLGLRKFDTQIPIIDNNPPIEALNFIDYASVTWDKITCDSLSNDLKPFDNIYALLFFLEILAVGRKLLFRGQSNCEWSLQSTLDRYISKGFDLISIKQKKMQYIEKVHQLSDRKHLSLCEEELEALCQHYGFPTDFIDFTWSSTIAAFFALGGSAAYSLLNDVKYPIGSIWVIDVEGIYNKGIKLITLPNQVMRPWLQRGEFLQYSFLKSSSSNLKIVNLTFFHQSEVWIDELYDLNPYSLTPLSRYLMPSRDPLEELADSLINS
jgi:hypothetical protein